MTKETHRHTLVVENCFDRVIACIEATIEDSNQEKITVAQNQETTDYLAFNSLKDAKEFSRELERALEIIEYRIGQSRNQVILASKTP